MRPFHSQPTRNAAHAIPRALLGLAFLLSLAPALLFAIGERVGWSECVEIVEAMYKFFGNWIAPGLILGFAVFFPLFGVYLIVEAVRRYRHAARQV